MGIFDEGKKKQVTYILRKFIIMTKNQFNRAIKKNWSDNGSQFISSNAQTLFDDFGIIHQKRCTYTTTAKWCSGEEAEDDLTNSESVVVSIWFNHRILG